jgi:cbb3-type cytochrome oxidase subunit 3
VIRDLATQTGASTWAIASMFFFMVVFVVVTLRVLTSKKGAYDRQARLPFEEGAAESTQPARPSAAPGQLEGP